MCRGWCLLPGQVLRQIRSALWQGCSHLRSTQRVCPAGIPRRYQIVPTPGCLQGRFLRDDRRTRRQVQQPVWSRPNFQIRPRGFLEENPGLSLLQGSDGIALGQIRPSNKRKRHGEEVCGVDDPATMPPGRAACHCRSDGRNPGCAPDIQVVPRGQP